MAILAAHIVGLSVFGVLGGYGLENTALELSIVVAAFVAALIPWNRQLRAASASLGLLTCSGILVHFWGGSTEAAFHFFVVVALLTLYQDWVPYLIAIVYVVLHFGLIGSAHPTYVYDNPREWEHPWRHAFIYGGFVAAMSAASIVTWRANELLLRDSLTGLPSRLVFLDRLTAALLPRARRKSFAVLLFDLDGFKKINDRHGHAAGDAVLRIVGQRVAGILRETQTLARLGGDEFAIISPDIRTATEARSLARRVSDAVGMPIRFEKVRLTTRASIGIALASKRVRPTELMRLADEAMYRAKRSKTRAPVVVGLDTQ